MGIIDVMASRHSVRQYLDKPLEEDKIANLKSVINWVNDESGFNFQLFTNECEAFQANQPHYGKFENCKNYFALVGPKDADEQIGYYGEKLVLQAQQLGLNTCWVVLTFEKSKVNALLDKGQKLHAVIALGYGANQGKPHKDKSIDKVSNLNEESATWFKDGMKAVMLAPTAMNQQKFYFEQVGAHTVRAKAQFGVYTKMDLGIAKYHFEQGAGIDNFGWIK